MIDTVCISDRAQSAQTFPRGVPQTLPFTLPALELISSVFVSSVALDARRVLAGPRRLLKHINTSKLNRHGKRKRWKRKVACAH
jgi:hypothetical protein